MKYVIPVDWGQCGGYGEVTLERRSIEDGGPPMVRIEISGGRKKPRWVYIPIDILQKLLGNLSLPAGDWVLRGRYTLWKEKQ